MDDQQLLRYSRHILLDEIGIEGQQQLLDSHALIIGLGGLGSPAAMYLAASGVGTLTLCDHDQVDFSNLQRQIVHNVNSVGQSKVESARHSLQQINPEIHCATLAQRADAAQLNELVAAADVVLDCCDNFDTRYAVNQACLQHHTPLVSGAAVQFDGQVSVFDFRQDNAACYNCLFDQESAAEELRCATTGIFAPLVGIIGSIQAAEALKVLMHIDSGLSGQLLTLNALDMRPMRSRLRKDESCKVCHPK